MSVTPIHDEWLHTIHNVFDAHLAQGGFAVLFPEYRPDMTRALANELGLDFYDYREDIMLPMGWEADQISLQDLTRTLSEKAAHSGLVAHNVEALLATKSPEQRRQWLADFVSNDWLNPVVLTLSIYGDEAKNIDDDNTRVCSTGLETFPEETFLMRLAMN